MECSSHEWTAENENRKKLSSIAVNCWDYLSHLWISKLITLYIEQAVLKWKRISNRIFKPLPPPLKEVTWIKHFFNQQPFWYSYRSFCRLQKGTKQRFTYMFCLKQYKRIHQRTSLVITRSSSGLEKFILRTIDS